MYEDIKQLGLPELFKKKAIHTETFFGHIQYKWRYNESSELIEWLEHNKYITTTINVYKLHKNHAKYFGSTWMFKGESIKSRYENIEQNYCKARQFLKDIHIKNHDLYMKYFLSPKTIWMKSKESFTINQ